MTASSIRTAAADVEAKDAAALNQCLAGNHEILVSSLVRDSGCAGGVRYG